MERSVASHRPRCMRPRALTSILTLAVAALALSACGSAADAPEAPSPSTPEVIGRGAVMKQSPTADIELCTGAMLTSYPPQCGGPRLLGAFSWDDVESEQHGGVRWTNEWYVAVGHYDRAANTFTLTRPLSSEPPAGFAEPRPEPVDFPQLCADPFRGGDPAFAGDMAAQDALQQRLEELDGYVGSWVSDGHDLFNVLVTGDAEAAHAELREIWPGGLCVEQRAAATERDVGAAQLALGEHFEELGITSSGGAPGVLDVGLTLADEATVTRIHEIVSPWLAPEQVTITSIFVPLVEDER